jgi:hypothetical protein
MEKRGDLLNQLAIISDLIEKMNLESESSTLTIGLDETNFKKTFDYICKMTGKKGERVEAAFTVKVGVVEITFNRSSV